VADGENGSSSNGSRAVTNNELKKDLQILQEQMMAKLDLLIQAQTYAEKAQEALRGEMQKNAKDILTLRDHAHDMANTLTRHEALYTILPSSTALELIQLLPRAQSAIAMMDRRGLVDVMTPTQLALVQTMERELDEDKVKALADEVAKRQKRTARWYELPREVVGGAVGVVILVLATHFDAIWHTLFH